MEKQRERDAKSEEKRSGSSRARARSSRQTAGRKSSRSSNVVIRYFQETGVELQKVTWPTQETVVRLTLMVLAVTIIFAIFLGGLDILTQRLLGLFI